MSVVWLNTVPIAASDVPRDLPVSRLDPSSVESIPFPHVFATLCVMDLANGAGRRASSVRDSFFALGGYSLLVVRLIWFI